MMSRRSRAVAVFVACVAFAGISAGCAEGMPFRKQEEGVAPEVAHKDWKTLRSLIARYNASRSEMEAREVLVVQNELRMLTESHSGDRIGDEALYYVGRIFYDLRAYHDARMVLSHHREFYPSSEFISTSEKLMEQMDRELADYNRWLEESRVGGNAGK